MQLGATFSHPHLKWLGIKPQDAIKEYNKLGLEWIRLGTYWNEVETKEGKYDFSELDNLVQYCEKKKIKVVLTVGMRAPRWPEYYLPSWLTQELKLKYIKNFKLSDKRMTECTLRLINKTVNHYTTSTAIKVWQAENEPFEPYPSNFKMWWTINPPLLEKEIEVVTNIDNQRRILFTSSSFGHGVNKLIKNDVIENVDIVGLDVYPKHPVVLPIIENFPIYIKNFVKENSYRKLVGKIKRHQKKFWITELQAEPWEPGEVLTKKKNPPSFILEDFEKNLNFILKLNPEVVLFWGFEYWLYRKLKKDDDRYWNEAKRVILKYS